MFVISPVLNTFDVLFKKPHNISRLQQTHNNSCRGLEAWEGSVQAQQGVSVPAWGLHAQHNISSLLKLWPCKTGARFKQERCCSSQKEAGRKKPDYLIAWHSGFSPQQCPATTCVPKAIPHGQLGRRVPVSGGQGHELCCARRTRGQEWVLARAA